MGASDLLYFQLFSYIAVSPFVSGNLREAGFVLQKLCHFEDRLRSGLVSNSTVASKLKCAKACMSDQMCHGFSVKINTPQKNSHSKQASGSNLQHVCYIYQEYFEECDDNDKVEIDHNYYTKHGICYNDGKWNVTLGFCECKMPSSRTDKAYGKFCSSPARSCHDFYLVGDTNFRGYRLLTPTINGETLNIYCNMLNNLKRTVVGVNRLSSTLDFNKTFSDFEETFGKISTNYYWLGLRNIRAIIQSSLYPVNILVGVRYPSNRNVNGISGITNAKLSRREHGYRLTYDGHLTTGSVKSDDIYCLRDSNGSLFSTYDVDRDGNSTLNCAAINGGGWWYNDCNSPCNIFGRRVTESQHVGLPEYVRVASETNIANVAFTILYIEI